MKEEETTPEEDRRALLRSVLSIRSKVNAALPNIDLPVDPMKFAEELQSGKYDCIFDSDLITEEEDAVLFALGFARHAQDAIRRGIEKARENLKELEEEEGKGKEEGRG